MHAVRGFHTRILVISIAGKLGISVYASTKMLVSRVYMAIAVSVRVLKTRLFRCKLFVSVRQV